MSLLKQIQPLRDNPLPSRASVPDLSSSKTMEQLLDELSVCSIIQELARRYPYCRVTVQIQNGQVVHNDLNLSHKPSSNQLR